MTLTSVGYPGRLNVADFARIVAGNFGSVFTPDDLKVTAAVGTRLLSVSAGSYAGQGVRDTNSAPVTVPDIAGGDPAVANPPTGQSRWDCVALHRHWAPGDYDTSVIVVPGAAGITPPIAYPAALEASLAGIGTDHDVPLFLAKFTSGLTDVQDLVDVRPFAGHGGGVTLLDPRAPLPPWAVPGQTVDLAGQRWTRRLVGGVLSWVPVNTARAAPFRWSWGGVPYGWAVPDGGATQAPGAQRIVPVLAGRRYHFESVFTLVDNGPGTIARAFLTINGGLVVDVEVGNDNSLRVGFPIHLSIDYVAVADGTVTVGTAFAGNAPGSWQVYQNFASPYSTWRDDGPL